MGELGEGEFAAVEPDQKAIAAGVEVEIADVGYREGAFIHGAAAPGAADGFGGVAGEIVEGFGFEFGEGFSGEGADGLEAGELDEVAMALRAAKEAESFVVFRFEGDVAGGADSHGDWFGKEGGGSPTRARRAARKSWGMGAKKSRMRPSRG